MQKKILYVLIFLNCVSLSAIQSTRVNQIAKSVSLIAALLASSTTYYYTNEPTYALAAGLTGALTGLIAKLFGDIYTPEYMFEQIKDEFKIIEQNFFYQLSLSHTFLSGDYGLIQLDVALDTLLEEIETHYIYDQFPYVLACEEALEFLKFLNTYNEKVQKFIHDHENSEELRTIVQRSYIIQPMIRSISRIIHGIRHNSSYEAQKQEKEQIRAIRERERLLREQIEAQKKYSSASQVQASAALAHTLHSIVRPIVHRNETDQLRPPQPPTQRTQTTSSVDDISPAELKSVVNGMIRHNDLRFIHKKLEELEKKDEGSS